MKYLYGTAVMAAALASAQAQDASGALVSTALEFLSRASSTSEVLTLNLTNLLILLALKAAILAFGIFAAGSSAVGRSSDSTSITETDLTGGMCFMMHLSGAADKLSCVQRAACEDPKTASDYYTAGKMWSKAHIVLGLPFPEEYQVVLSALDEARELGEIGGECSVYQW